MKAIKKSDLVLNARFVLGIGTVKIVNIIKDGYGKGDDKFEVQFETDGEIEGMKFCDDATELKSFLNTHKIKSK